MFCPVAFPVDVNPNDVSIVFALVTSTDIGNGLLRAKVGCFIVTLIVIYVTTVLCVFLSRKREVVRGLKPMKGRVVGGLITFFAFYVNVRVSIANVSRVFRLDVL